MWWNLQETGLRLFWQVSEKLLRGAILSEIRLKMLIYRYKLCIFVTADKGYCQQLYYRGFH